MTDTATLMDSYTEMTEILLPNDTNDLGRALGGAVLHWMGVCGAVAAMRFSKRQCVTASMDHRLHLAHRPRRGRGRGGVRLRQRGA